MDSVSKLRKRVQRTRFPALKTESNGLSFQARKPSPMDSVFKAGNRVLWTHFLSIETESIGLDFFVSSTANFPSVPCLITPTPQQHQLPTAATSRGHNSPPTAASVPNPPRGHNNPPTTTSRGSQLDWFLAVGSHNFSLWNSLSSLTYHSALTSTDIHKLT